MENDRLEVVMPRREVLKKAGRYAAFTAVVAVVLLSPKPAQAGSTYSGDGIAPAGRGWGTGSQSTGDAGNRLLSPFGQPQEKADHLETKSSPWK